MAKYTKKDVIKICKEKDVKFIRLWFADITGQMKGFAITLALGVVVSMFSAIVITRNLMRIFTGNWLKNKSWLLGMKIKQDKP